MIDKVKQLVEIEGFDDEMNAIEEATYDSIAAGICCNQNCKYTVGVEPDCRAGYCPECKTHSVKSILVLKGMV